MLSDPPVPENAFHLSRRWSDSRLVVSVEGDVDSAESAAIVAVIDAAASATGLSFELSNLGFAASAFLSALLHAARRFESDGQQVVLLNPTPQLVRLLDDCRLTHLFEVRLC
jgi:anti-anti-sigma factor